MDRAWEHFCELRDEVGSFLKSNPYKPVMHFDPEKEAGFRRITRGALVIRLVPEKEIPPRIGILIGETLQQFRSSLDHIAWDLSLLSTDKPLDSTGFPVCKDEGCFRHALRKKIRDVPSGAQDAIREMQPYRFKQPQEHPLWMLHRLANEDKHRFTHVVAGMVTHFHLRNLAGISSIVVNRGPFHDETDVVVAGVASLEEAEVHMKKIDFAKAIELCFAEGGPGLGRPVLGLLDAFGGANLNAIDEFAAFFG